MVLDITKEEWDVVEGKQTHLYTIKDDETGFMVQISDYGATLVHVTVPNKDGKPQEITFGQDNAGDFRKNFRRRPGEKQNVRICCITAFKANLLPSYAV